MKFNVFFIVIGIVSITYIYRNAKIRSHWEAESLLWIFGSSIILVLSIFPKLIDRVAKVLGIYYPPSLLFLLSILILMLLLFRQSKQISFLNQKINELSQRAALLENKISHIENQNSKI